MPLNTLGLTGIGGLTSPSKRNSGWRRIPASNALISSHLAGWCGVAGVRAMLWEGIFAWGRAFNDSAMRIAARH